MGAYLRLYLSRNDKSWSSLFSCILSFWTLVLRALAIYSFHASVKCDIWWDKDKSSTVINFPQNSHNKGWMWKELQKQLITQTTERERQENTDLLHKRERTNQPASTSTYLLNWDSKTMHNCICMYNGLAGVTLSRRISSTEVQDKRNKHRTQASRLRVTWNYLTIFVRYWLYLKPVLITFPESYPIRTVHTHRLWYHSWPLRD